MKINNDLNQYQAGRGVISHGSPADVPAAANPDITRRGSDLPSRLDQERTMNEALAIAHMSHVLIQKAMEISGRLHSIAMRAMTSGSVDNLELGNVMSSMNASFSAFGEKMPLPVVSGKGGGTDWMEGLRSIAGDLSSGTIPDRKAFEKVDRQIAAGMDDAIRMTGRNPHDLNPDSALRVIIRTSGHIAADPGKGMAAHNPHRPETVMKLVG